MRLEGCSSLITAAAIPDDLLIYEVLIHLPVKSLARCRCVCRSWRTAIAGATFVRRHLELSRARPPSLLAVPREIDPSDDYATSTTISLHRLPPLPPPPPGTIIDTELIFEKAWTDGITRLISLTHCHGLVAIATATDRVFVCNQATGEFIALPLGSHNAELEDREMLVPPVALGFDRWRNCYVVGRYFYRAYGKVTYNDVTGEYSQDYDIGHDVLTLATVAGGSSWELTEDPPHAAGIQSPICTRRAFYWHSYVPKPRLMRFSLKDRTFAVVPRPPAGSDPLGLDEMTELDGKLCYVHAATEASFQVWMADDGRADDELQWSFHFGIDFGLNPDPNLNFFVRPVIYDGNKMLLKRTALMEAGKNWHSSLFWYTVSNKALEEVVDLHHELQYVRPDGTKFLGESQGLFSHHVLPYFESLVSLTACNY
ncbi:unnamed protein product [Urochloa humidicola]